MAGSVNSHAAPLTDYRPVCQQSWSQGLRRTCRSSPSVAGATASTHFLSTHGWMAQAEPLIPQQRKPTLTNDKKI